MAHQETRWAAGALSQEAIRGRLWDTSFEGWEDVSFPPPTERTTENGLVVIWQVKIGNKFGCNTWVDMAPRWSNDVEASYQGQKNIVTVDEGHGRWAMDPDRLVQTNADTLTIRPMRRVVVTNGPGPWNPVQ